MVVIVSGGWIVEKNKGKVEVFDRQSRILRPKSSRCCLARSIRKRKANKKCKQGWYLKRVSTIAQQMDKR